MRTYLILTLTRETSFYARLVALVFMSTDPTDPTAPTTPTTTEVMSVRLTGGSLAKIVRQVISEIFIFYNYNMTVNAVIFINLK